MIMGTQPQITVVRRRRGRGLGTVDCTQDYWSSRGTIGTSNCSPTDTACIQAQTAAVSAFNDQWSACVTGTMGTGPQYVALATQSGDPNTSLIQAQLSWQAQQNNAVLNPQYPVVAAATTVVPTTPPAKPKPPAPQVVNPSPKTQSTSTGTTQTSTTSVTSQTNGTTSTAASTGLLSTVGGYLTDPTKDLISGIPNWVLLAVGVGGVVLIMSQKSGRR